MQWNSADSAVIARPILFKTISGSIFHGYLFHDEKFYLYHPIFNAGELIAKFGKEFIVGWIDV